MNITGDISRFFADISSGTFVFNNIKTNALLSYPNGNESAGSGSELRFGLTGITGNYYWFFSLKNGKIYDPENRFISCYDSDSTINISGNFDTGHYDYYLNNQLFCSVGNKKNINFNGFYIQSISGATGIFDANIAAQQIDMFATPQNWFYLNGIWSGNLYHNSSGAVTIYSGNLFMPDSQYFYLSGTGLSFNNGTNIIGSGGNRVFTINHTGIVDRSGIFNLGLFVYTDYGNHYFYLTGSGLPSAPGFISNYLSPSSGYNFTSSGSGLTGNYSWNFSESFLNYNNIEQNKTIYTELSYLSGYTGQMNWLTGFTITNSGKSYTTNPIIYVSPIAGGFPYASGSGLLGGPSNTGITGILWMTSGIYTGNTSNYAISYLGGGGNSFTATPLWGLGYTKTFSGQYDLITGIWNVTGSNCNKKNNMCSGFVNLNTNVLMATTINYIGLPDTAPTMYKLKFSGLADTESLQSVYEISGINYKQ